MRYVVPRAAAILVPGLIVLLTGPAASAGRPQGQSKVALVTVVAEAAGPIRDLTVKDFTVTEDGQKREVLSVELAEDPLSIALLVDSTQPPLGTIPPTQDLRTALATFVKAIRGYSPGVKIALSEVAGASVPKASLTAMPGELDSAIGRLYPNHQGDAVLLEALIDAGKLLATQPPPRRAIVSVDFNSREGSAERSMKSAAEEVHKAGATLWAVSVRGTGAPAQNREEVLNKIVQANGGLRLMPVDSPGLEPNLKIVANSLASQYTVTFTRPGGGKPKVTKMETSRGAKVQLTPWMR